MLSSRAWLAIPLGLLALLVAAGALVPLGVGPQDRVAVGRTPSGDTRLLYAGCPGEQVTAVRLSAYEGGSRSYGVPIYWLVESLSGETVDEVVVGVIPDGFVETVPLRVASPDDDLVKLSGIDEAGGLSAKLGELEVERVQTGGYDDLTEASFRAAAGRACVSVITLAFLTFAMLPLAVVGFVGALRRARQQGRLRYSFVAWSGTGALATFYVAVFLNLRSYDLTPLGVGSLLIASTLYGALAGAVGIAVSPVANAISRLARSGPTRPRISRCGGTRTGEPPATVARVALVLAAAAGPTGLIVAFGIEGGVPLVIVAWALAAATAAVISTRPSGDDGKPTPRLPRQELLAAVAAGLVVGALGVALLDNDPDEPTEAARRMLRGLPASPVATGALVAELDERDLERDVEGFPPEAELRPGGPYQLTARCGGPSLQVSERIRSDRSSSAVRRVLPCDGLPVPGSFPDQGPVHLTVVDNAQPGWSLEVRQVR